MLFGRILGQSRNYLEHEWVDGVPAEPESPAPLVVAALRALSGWSGAAAVPELAFANRLGRWTACQWQ